MKLKLKLKLKNKIGMMLSLVVVGTTVLALNSFDSKGSEVKLVEANNESILIKDVLTEGNGLSKDLSGNPYGFAKILNSNYEPVATKVRIDYDESFFNKLEGKIDYLYGMNLEDITEEEWVEFYKSADSQGVGNYLKKSGEHTLVVRVAGTMFMDNTIKFVDINNVEKHGYLAEEIDCLNKWYDIDQYLIEECNERVFVKSGLKYKEVTGKKREAVLDFDEKLKLETGAKLSLKYYEDETPNGAEDNMEDKLKEKESETYRLKTVEVYNKDVNSIYINENFSKETLNLIEKIRKGNSNLDIKYRETNDLYNYSI